MSAVAQAVRGARRLPSAASEQLLVMSAQMLSGVGNFAFSVLMAHMLEPRDFAALRAFLALYLIVHVPTGSLSAGAALKPELAVAGRTRAMQIGLAIAAALAVAAVPAGALLHLPALLVVVLAATVPVAGLLALNRGRLWGLGRHRRGASSLLVEVVGRFVFGAALAIPFGAIGAAVGVVLGGYVSLAVVSEWGRDRAARSSRGLRDSLGLGEAGWTIAAFLLMALIGNQDLLFANRLLPAAEAARFAGVSTLGGIAVFATTSIPTLLIPRAARGETNAIRVAMLLAAGLGAAAVVATLVAPGMLVEAVLGPRYASAEPLLTAYMLAMAVLGVARVLIAERCATRGGIGTVVLLGTACLLHGALLATLAHDAAGVVNITLGTTVVLLALFGAMALAPRVASLARSFSLLRDRFSALARSTLEPSALLILLMTTIAAAFRVVVPRGLWVDEAITLGKAQLPFTEMIESLRFSDVHPPLHYALEWVVVRALGTSELALRLPSAVAGALLVPMLYLLGRRLFDRRTALLGAALGALSPILIWYSQEARMYALLMLLSVTALWAQLYALQKRSGWGWIIYALATIAMISTQYFAILQVVVQQIGFLAAFWRRRNEGRRVARSMLAWAASAVVIAAALAPLVPFAIDQYHANEQRYATGAVPSTASRTDSDSGNEMSVYTLIANSVWATVGYHSDHTMSQIVALWPLGMVAAIVLLGRGRPSRYMWFVIGAALVPIMTLFAVGFSIRPVFEVRYFVTAAPLLMLLLARLITACASRPMVLKGVAGAAIAVLLIAGVDQQINGTNPRLYDFRGALQEVARRAEPGDVVVYQPQFLQSVIEYYLPGIEARPAGESPPKLTSGDRAFLIGSFLDDKSISGQTGGALAELDERYRMTEEFERPQVRVWVFEPTTSSR